LPLRNIRSRSRSESDLRVALSLDGLTFFEVNVAIHDAFGQWLAEPDLSCKDARLALEYQGADHAELKRMRADITRTGDLRRPDWLTIPYGPAEVFKRPWQIAPEIRQLVMQRAPQLLAPAPRVGSSAASGHL